MLRRAVPYAVGFTVLAVVHYFVNHWLGTPISLFQTSVLSMLYFSQYVVALLGVYLIWNRKAWFWGVAVLACQFLFLEYVAYLFIYGILPAGQEGFHAAGAPFIASQFRGRVLSGYAVVLACAVMTQATRSFFESREQRRELAHSLEGAVARLQALENTRGQLLIGSHFLRNMMVTVANYGTRAPGRRAAEASQALLELLEYVIQATRSTTMLVGAATEWHHVENLLLLVRVKHGHKSVRMGAIPRRWLGQSVPAFSWLTLIENALVHGMVSPSNPVCISVVNGAAGLSFQCQNAIGPPQQPRHNGGQGLSLLRERLEKTMHGRYDLCREERPGYFQVLLTTNSNQ